MLEPEMARSLRKLFTVSGVGYSTDTLLYAANAKTMDISPTIQMVGEILAYVQKLCEALKAE